MEKANCSLCLRPKANFICSLCQKQTCKNCTEVLSKDGFMFLERVPEFATHRYYCGPCFDEQIRPMQENYSRNLEQAKQLNVFFKNQSEETRAFNRSEKPLSVKDCADREEALLKLAFLAAQKNFNALLMVELIPKKIRNHGYQTTSWNASGIPTHVDPEKINIPKGKYFLGNV